ncbi:MAG: hypothetical protein D6726_12365 [Nitrospirae bacterium]|nr:MAG: hypothetical protein D6726_12365 [Nitrospirota bacterium]
MKTKGLIILVALAFLFIGRDALAGCLTVVSPNGGEVWPPGTSHNIQWSSSCPPDTNVKIILRKGGQRVGPIISGISASAGSYPWIAGQYQGGTAPEGRDYRILIKTMDNTIKDASDGDFSISSTGNPVFAAIRVTMPNENSEVIIGKEAHIRWRSMQGVTLPEYVDIKLMQNGTSIMTIASSVRRRSAIAGYYQWSVPISLQPGKYRIKINSTDSPGILGYSEEFEIIPDMPDLRIARMTIDPQRPIAGKQVTFTAVIVNDGSSIAPASTARLKIEGLQTQPVFVNFNVPSLGHAQKYQITHTYNLTLHNRFRNTLTLDINNKVVELKEDNNEQVLTYGAVFGPDLIVWLASPQVHMTTPDTVRVGVLNRGNAISGYTNLKVWIEGKGMTIFRVKPLGPCEFKVFERKERFWTNFDKKINIEVDPENNVSELNEQNNILKETLNVTISHGYELEAPLYECIVK